MTSVKNLASRHPVSAFFFLAYLFTWSVWAPISSGYVRGMFELSPSIIVLCIAGSFGSLLSASIVTSLSGKSLRVWFTQALGWRVPVKWWLAALLIPTLLYALMAGIHMLLGGKFNPGEVAPLLSLPAGFLSVFLFEEMFTRTGKYARAGGWILLVIGLIVVRQIGFFRSREDAVLWSSQFATSVSED